MCKVCISQEKYSTNLCCKLERRQDHTKISIGNPRKPATSLVKELHKKYKINCGDGTVKWVLKDFWIPKKIFWFLTRIALPKIEFTKCHPHCRTVCHLHQKIGQIFSGLSQNILCLDLI